MTGNRTPTSSWLTHPLVPVWAAGFAGFLVFLLQLNPGFNWYDSAEFVGVARTFGIVHPSGYPLYSLLGRLSVLGIGWLTSPVIAANLLSALAAGATCGIMVMIGRKLFVLLRLGPVPRLIRILAACLPPAILAGHPVFLDQALVAEVYTLNTLLVALLILTGLVMVQKAEQPRRMMNGAGGEVRSGWWGSVPGGWRYPLIMAFLAGIALGNHVTIILIYPALVGLFLWSLTPENTLGLRPPTDDESHSLLTAVIPLVLFLALGLTLYLVLPLRAGLQPPYNWGDATTLRSFFRLVTAAEIRARPGTYNPITPLTIWGRVAAGIGPVVLALALLGWFTAGLRRRRLGLVAILYVIFPLLFLLLGLDIQEDALLPFHLWVVLGIGPGVVLVAERLIAVFGLARGRVLTLAAIGLLAIFGPGWRIVDNWGEGTPRPEYGPAAYTEAIVASVAGRAEPETAVEGWVFCEDNTTAFLLWDMQRRGVRPGLHGIYLLLAREEWYQEELRRTAPDLVVPSLDRSYERQPHAAAALELIRANIGRGHPLFLSPIQLPPEEIYGVLVPQGLLFRLESPGYVPTEEDVRRHLDILSACSPAFQPGETPALDPQSTDVWSWRHLRIGEAWLRLGMLPAAEAEYRAAVRLAPGRIETWMEMASFFTVIGDPAGAEAALREALLREPRNEEARVMLARALSLQGAWAAADSLLPAGRLRSVPRSEYLKVRAGIRLGQGNASAALNDLEEAVRLAPDNGELWNDLGVVYLQRGRWDEALPSFERAVELSPGLSEAWLNLGMIAIQDSRWSDAAGYMEQAIEAGANSPEVRHSLGVALFNDGDYAASEEALRSNLRLWPSHAETYLALGYLYEQQNRIREAIAIYNAGRAAAPGDGRFAQRLRRLQPPPA